MTDNISMKMWELVKDFQLKMPQLVKDMKASDHHYSETHLNPYHIEGDVWTHSQQVNLMAEMFNVNLIVKISALLHDVGKPMSRTVAEDKQRIRFFNHEGLSVFIGLDYMNTLDFLSDEDKVRICQLICFHTYLYQEMRKENYEAGVAQFFAGETELFKDLIALTKVDALGRFSESEERELWTKAEEHFSPVTYKINPFVYPRQTQGEAIILVGPPMSGKSTWVKNYAKDHLVLCRDQVIMDMAKGKNYNDAYRSVDQDKVNAEFSLLHKEALKSGKNLVFDLTNMSEKDRRKSLAGLPKQMKRKAVVFLAGYEVLKSRNEKRSKEENKHIPQYVLENMMGKFSMPMKSEGFDEIEYVFSK